jgi:GDP-L-fucose synthase
MMFTSKKVLVAGGAGFLATNLIARLLQTDASVRATLHRSPAQIDASEVEWMKCDLLQKSDCEKACEGMDILVLCAAQTAGAMVIENTPLVHLTPNLIMNAQLLEAAYHQGVKQVVFISSNTVYPLSDKPMKETDHTGEYFHKYHIVASMKYFSEQICQMYAERVKNPMQLSVIRPGNMYGPYDDFEWESSHVLPAFIRRIVERHQPISVWGDGKDIKDLIYVDDVVDGIFLALQGSHQYDAFNIASGKSYCLRDILTLMQDIDGYTEADVEYDDSKPTMIPIRLISVDKAREQLNFSAKTSIRDGLELTLQWYRNKHDYN